MKIENDRAELVIRIPWDQVERYLAEKPAVEKKEIIPEQAFVCADSLYNQILAHIKLPKPNRRAWAHEINMMNKKMGLGWIDIMCGIQYSQNPINVADKYFPVIHSAKALRDKWDKLINYWNKHEGESESFADKAGKYSEIGLF